MKQSSRKIQQEKLLVLLKQIRHDKGIRQTELAEKLGVPQSYVSKYEAGDRRLDLLELRQICDAMGISIYEFIEKLEDRLNETK